MSDHRWSLGTLIGLPLLVLLAACCLVGGWLLWRIRPGLDKYDRPMVTTVAVSCYLCALLVVVATAVGMWPYKAEYHEWRTTAGTVESIDSRLLSSGDGGPTERFVVTFDDGRQRSCDDTRCAQVREGDELTLACKRAWQWSGTHGYDCNYVAHEVDR